MRINKGQGASEPQIGFPDQTNPVQAKHRGDDLIAVGNQVHEQAGAFLIKRDRALLCAQDHVEGLIWDAGDWDNLRRHWIGAPLIAAVCDAVGEVVPTWP